MALTDSIRRSLFAALIRLKHAGNVVLRAWHCVGYFWRDFTGESAYDHYVQRHQREHPQCPVMSEREFWRERARFDEENVHTGCC